MGVAGRSSSVKNKGFKDDARLEGSRLSGLLYSGVFWVEGRVVP